MESIVKTKKYSIEELLADPVVEPFPEMNEDQMLILNADAMARHALNGALMLGPESPEGDSERWQGELLMRLKRAAMATPIAMEPEPKPVASYLFRGVIVEVSEDRRTPTYPNALVDRQSCVIEVVAETYAEATELALEFASPKTDPRFGDSDLGDRRFAHNRWDVRWQEIKVTR